VGHAGHSQRLAQFNRNGTFLVKVRTFSSRNNNWLIAQVTSKIMGAMVVYLHKLSSTSDTMEDLKPKLLTRTQAQTENATIDLKWLLDM
jgi:hypothetical protein